MDMQRALEIVIELAAGNIIDDPEMAPEAAEQNTAIAMVTGMLETPDVPVPPDSDYWKVLEQLRGRLEMIEAENKELRTKLELAREE